MQKKSGALPYPLTYLLGFILLYLALPTSCQAAGFTLQVAESARTLSLVGTFVLPGEALPLRAISPDTDDRFQLISTEGTLQPVGEREWRWKAPEAPGLYVLEVRRLNRGDAIRVHAFVMVPFQRLKGESLNGYHIGHYPSPKSPAYRLPRGFIEVTPANENALVSPHFRLKQFLCKQGGGYPKYVVLTERLLLKLEMLLAKVNDKGYHVASFHVMSGYRTPAYNRNLGNVSFSRHMFGDAADIYIEDPRTGQMADLNGDGRVDAKDAAVLYGIVQELGNSEPGLFPVGGAGTYEATRAHGPFLHVDARGFQAKWGTIVSAQAASTAGVRRSTRQWRQQ